MNGALPFPTLMLVTDRQRSRMPLVEAVRDAVAAGVDLVMLRETDLPDAAFRQLAIDLLGVVPGDRLIANGRPTIARELGIGVHLRDGQAFPEAEIGSEGLRGRSVHGLPRFGEDGWQADYLLAGNVFETRTHPERPARSTVWLGEIVRWSNAPVLAIGGITAGNVGQVLATGCHGVAVIDAILDQIDPISATRALRLALDDHGTNGRNAVATWPAVSGRDRE